VATRNTAIDAVALSRPTLDVGLFSDNPAMPEFYTRVLGLPLVESLPHSPTYSENFYGATDASIKINYSTEPMEVGASGYRGLVLAREGVAAPRAHVDPDGLSVTIVPPGRDGVVQMGIVCDVADAGAERAFLVEGLGARDDGGVLRIGQTALFLRTAEVAAPTPVWRRGFNYYVLFVNDIMRAHEHAVAHGAEHSASPLLLGERCAFSWVRAPSGNWIEFAQYAQYGVLPKAPFAADRWPEITRWRESGEPF
jgi:lactoylglutathione lyase